MAQEAKGIRYQLQLAADAKDSLKSRMRENRKYGSEEGRRQQCRPPTQQQIHARYQVDTKLIPHRNFRFGTYGIILGKAAF